MWPYIPTVVFFADTGTKRIAGRRGRNKTRGVKCVTFASQSHRLEREATGRTVRLGKITNLGAFQGAPKRAREFCYYLRVLHARVPVLGAQREPNSMKGPRGLLYTVGFLIHGMFNTLMF